MLSQECPLRVWNPCEWTASYSQTDRWYFINRNKYVVRWLPPDTLQCKLLSMFTQNVPVQSHSSEAFSKRVKLDFHLSYLRYCTNENTQTSTHIGSSHISADEVLEIIFIVQRTSTRYPFATIILGNQLSSKNELKTFLTYRISHWKNKTKS